jgi:hypothetical protein
MDCGSNGRVSTAFALRSRITAGWGEGADVVAVVSSKAEVTSGAVCRKDVVSAIETGVGALTWSLVTLPLPSDVCRDAVDPMASSFRLTSRSAARTATVLHRVVLVSVKTLM